VFSYEYAPDRLTILSQIPAADGQLLKPVFPKVPTDHKKSSPKAQTVFHCFTCVFTAIFLP
jgi:hypothetical protein